MRGVLLAAAIAVGALSAAFVTPAAARDYAYCAQGRGFGIPGDCSYSSYQQCVASASGRNLSCNINPRVAFGRQRVYSDRFAPRERTYRRGYRNRYDGYDRRY